MSSVERTQVELVQLDEKALMEPTKDAVEVVVAKDTNDTIVTNDTVNPVHAEEKQNIAPESNLLVTESLEDSAGENLRDKSQSLIDIANCTFRELCKTLENEQMKLRELEQKRIKLHEEMQRLKAEIEEEKNIYNFHLSGKYKDLQMLGKDVEQQIAREDKKDQQQEQQQESEPQCQSSVIGTLETIEESVHESDMELDSNAEFSAIESKESTMEYIQRQRNRLELINQGIPLSQIMSEDALSDGVVLPSEDEPTEELTDGIIDQCIPSNLSMLQQNQSFTTSSRSSHNNQ